MINQTKTDKLLNLITDEVETGYIDFILCKKENHDLWFSLHEVIKRWSQLDYDSEHYSTSDEKVVLELALEYRNEIEHFLSTTQLGNFIINFEAKENPMFTELMSKVEKGKNMLQNQGHVDTFLYSPFYRPLEDDVWMDYSVIAQIELRFVKDNKSKVDVLNIFQWEVINLTIVDLHEVNPAIKMLSRHKEKFYEFDDFFVYTLPVLVTKGIVDNDLRLLSKEKLKRCYKSDSKFILEAQKILGYTTKTKDTDHTD
jgi:hypothetical protein